MSKNNYEVNSEILKTLDNFEVLILTLPEGEIDDKLTYFTREKGKITRSFYEDFLFANLIANINGLMSQLQRALGPESDLLEIRAELMEVILKHNPLMSPDNLVINKNYVVKRKQTKRLREGERMLTDLSSWNVSYYEEIDKLRDQLTGETGEKQDKKKAKVKDKAKAKSLDISELEFEEHQVWWKRIGQYVKIKQFKEEDAESILKKRYFHSPTSFNTFIVSVCVVDFEDLFALLDNMGIPSRVAPPILMNELYELCKKINPFLTYDNAQELAEDDAEPVEDTTPRQSPYRTTAATGTTKKSKKSKKTFKDVPKEDLLRLGENMKVFLIGQDEAVENLAESIQIARIGLKEPHRPIGSFLFAGKTGVGKTLATKVLADELIKDKDNLVTIDCSEYSSDHEYAKLIGAPSGYIGHEQGGVLTNAMMKNPFTVVVFDEVEKASHKVHELLLQILEEGRLTDGKGQRVSFKDAIVILTSNVGVKEVDGISKTIGFGDVSKITDDKRSGAIKKALKKKFKPEFLNRLDNVIFFNDLKKDDYMRIIEIELNKLNDNLHYNETDYQSLTLEFDKSVKKFVFENGIDEEYGARPLKRCIRKEISKPLALKLLSEDENIDSNSKIKISAKKGKVKFNIEMPEPSKESEKSVEAVPGE